METGKVVKIHNLPRPIPVEIPKVTPKPQEKPIRVDNWPTKVPEKVEK